MPPRSPIDVATAPLAAAPDPTDSRARPKVRMGRWIDLPLRFKGLVVVAIPLVPLVITAALVHDTHRVERDLNADFARVVEVRTQVDAVLTLLIDSETAVRGYLLTADRSFLKPYDEAHKSIPGKFAHLATLVKVPAQRERLALVQRLAKQRLDRLQMRIEALQALVDPSDSMRRGEWLDTLAPTLAAGNRLMDDVRVEIGRMRDAESAILDAHAAAVRRTQDALLLIVSVGTGLGVVGGVLGAMLFTTGVARRIDVAAANAGRLAARQPLTPVAPSADEVGLLGARLEEGAALLAEHEQARAEAEAALRASAAQIQDLYDRAPCGYHSLDALGRYVAINQTELDWLGYTREQVVGRAFTDFLTPASRARFAERFAVFRETGVNDVESELQANDGRAIPVSVSASIVRGPDGEFVCTRSSLFDITERKRAEHDIRRLNAALEERVKGEQALNHELEAFSYSVSHDLRAPLRHVAGFAALLERKAGDQLDEEGRRLVGRMSLAATRMGRLIDDLLVFSRMGRAAMSTRPVDLGPLIEDVRQEVAADAAGRNLEWTIHPLPQVYGDPAMLRLAFVNLLSNAVKYTGTRARGEIEIGSPGGQNGEAIVYVRDNGVGFDMTYVDKLFGVFERLHTSSQFEGTGIGLASVRRVVHRHGGRAWAESLVDQGATFFVALPTHAPEVDR